MRKITECWSIRSAVPDNDRVVILLDPNKQKPLAVTARYRDGKWYGVETGADLLIEQSFAEYDYHWAEFPIGVEGALASPESFANPATRFGVLASPYTGRDG